MNTGKLSVLSFLLYLSALKKEYRETSVCEREKERRRERLDIREEKERRYVLSSFLFCVEKATNGILRKEEKRKKEIMKRLRFLSLSPSLSPLLQLVSSRRPKWVLRHPINK